MVSGNLGVVATVVVSPMLFVVTTGATVVGSSTDGVVVTTPAFVVDPSTGDVVVTVVTVVVVGQLCSSVSSSQS